MSGMKLTQVAPRASRSARPLAAVVVALIVVVAGGYGLTQLNRSDNAPAAVVVPIPTAALRPVEVSGTETCRMVDNGQYLNPVKRIARIDVCTDTMSDPRVSGDVTRQLSVETFQPGDYLPALAQRLWGTATLETDEGSWSGAFTWFANGDVVAGIWEALGSGGYDGLLYKAELGGTLDDPTVSGMITPLSEGQIVGAYNCQPTLVPDPTVVDGVEQYRGFEMACALTANDDRVTGTATHVVDIDVHPDGTAHAWGTVGIEQPNGSWTTQVDDVGRPATIWGATLKGTGDFAALQFRFTTTSPEPGGPCSALEGVIEPVE